MRCFDNVTQNFSGSAIGMQRRDFRRLRRANRETGCITAAGYGCGACPACRLRAAGYAAYAEEQAAQNRQKDDA